MVAKHKNKSRHHIDKKATCGDKSMKLFLQPRSFYPFPGTDYSNFFM